ncbi:alpha-amylase family glycosyl hydrolase [Euzebya sp.]|uniref:alpha-amylase family glycosyl hydrolase n=1 Tax=Euzebya sp. TaxID=1971409 RepID=UPI0035127E18
MSGTSLADALRAHLERLYDPAGARRALEGLLSVCATHASPPRPGDLDERDVWLIAYADHVLEEGRRPLQAMASLLADELADVVDGIHLLPFFPWTSDDGFAVVDHLAVDPAIGTWSDVEAIAADRRVMLDAVVNHVSASSRWVREWCAGERDGWVLEVPEAFDVERVVRPRTSPLRTAFEGPDAMPRFAWTTFGPDQVDLDYANPDVLVAMTEVLLRYAAHGASVIRLDAVGFLWKTSGTTCIHLPETHEVIRLWRTVLDACAPGTLLITETNVPHDENIRYFGAGDDEAHLVYQFPLAPLVLAAFTWGNAQDLTRWAASLADPLPGTAFLNFLGSHDGIGMRPAEGLLSAAQVEGLCDLARAAGGGVSHRAAADGSQTPYELNTTYVDALIAVADDGQGVARIAAAHAILLALQGVPGIWFGALFAIRNDPELVRSTGRLRSVNRARVDLGELRDTLDRPGTLRQVVFESLCRLIALRRSHPAFSPASPQVVLPAPGWLFAVVRGDPGRRVLVVVSVSDRDRTVRPAELAGGGVWVERLGGCDEPVTGGDPLVLPPYGVAWLEER